MSELKKNIQTVTFQQRLLGWLIHAFTASGAFIGLLALNAIHEQKLLFALQLMGVSVLIDAVDGMFARMVNIKVAIPNIDGALLDNIVDFFTYTLVPCFFVLVTSLVPSEWRYICIAAITFASAYQFVQIDAKTSDHFFKGFPSYWNIAIFYLFFWQMKPITNLIILFTLAVLSFVPIKYVYPSRLDYLTKSSFLRGAMVLVTIIWGMATAGLLWLYPESNKVLVGISISYILLYIGISLYRTWYPLPIKKRKRKAK